MAQSASRSHRLKGGACAEVHAGIALVLRCRLSVLQERPGSEPVAPEHSWECHGLSCLLTEVLALKCWPQESSAFSTGASFCGSAGPVSLLAASFLLLLSACGVGAFLGSLQMNSFENC